MAELRVTHAYDTLSVAALRRSSQPPEVGDGVRSDLPRRWSARPLIQAVDRGEKLVLISVGRRDVRVGEVLAVYRYETTVGKVEIVRVFDNVCAARIVEEGEAKIQPADGLRKRLRRRF